MKMIDVHLTPFLYEYASWALKGQDTGTMKPRGYHHVAPQAFFFQPLYSKVGLNEIIQGIAFC